MNKELIDVMHNNIKSVEDKFSVVAYTDGSCYPNPGYGSSSYFYYVFKNKELGEKLKGIGSKVSLTSLGVLTSDHIQENPNVLSNSEFVLPISYTFGTKREDNITSFIAELYAVKELFISLKKNCYVLEDKDVRFTHVLIKSDNEAVIKILKYLKLELDKLRKAGLNQDNPITIETLVKQELFNRFSYPKEITELFRHILDIADDFTPLHTYGHSSSIGNNIVDRLALLSREKQEDYKGIIYNKLEDSVFKYYTEDTGYELRPMVKDELWKPLELEDDFNFKNVYFLNGHTKDNPYLVLDYTKESVIGDRSPDALMGSIYNTTSDLLDNIASSQLRDTRREISILYGIDLTAIKDTIPSILYRLIGERSFAYSSRGTLTIGKDYPIILRLSPNGLCKELIDKFVKHNTIRDLDIKGESGIYHVEDITKFFFKESNKKKQKYECVLDTKIKSIDFKTKTKLVDKELKISLLLGSDIPSRNYIKRLETNRDIAVRLYIEPMDNYDNLFMHRVSVVFNYLDMEDNRHISIWENFFCIRC